MPGIWESMGAGDRSSSSDRVRRERGPASTSGYLKFTQNKPWILRPYQVPTTMRSQQHIITV